MDKKTWELLEEKLHNIRNITGSIKSDDIVDDTACDGIVDEVRFLIDLLNEQQRPAELAALEQVEELALSPNQEEARGEAEGITTDEIESA